MRFYRLTRPYYETDIEEARVNPVGETGSESIPSLLCEACGGQSSSSRLRIPLPTDPDVLNLLNGKSYPRQEWSIVVAGLASRLGVELSALEPGMSVGPPRGEVCRPVLNDIAHTAFGLLWVKRHVVDALRGMGVTGVTYQRVELQWAMPWDDFDEEVTPTQKPPWVPPEQEPPELWELVVSGQAWREGMDLERITLCKACGRTGFPEPGWIKVDESRRDGSDFFHLDTNPNMVFVTERVCETLAKHTFTNYECVPVPYPVKGPSWR